MAEQNAETDTIKTLVRDLGDMACIGCRGNTCPACGLAAEITNQVHVLVRAALLEYAHIADGREAYMDRLAASTKRKESTGDGRERNVWSLVAHELKVRADQVTRPAHTDPPTTRATDQEAGV